MWVAWNVTSLFACSLDLFCWARNDEVGCQKCGWQKMAGNHNRADLATPATRTSSPSLAQQPMAVPRSSALRASPRCSCIRRPVMRRTSLCKLRCDVAACVPDACPVRAASRGLLQLSSCINSSHLPTSTWLPTKPPRYASSAHFAAVLCLRTLAGYDTPIAKSTNSSQALAPA